MKATLKTVAIAVVVAPIVYKETTEGLGKMKDHAVEFGGWVKGLFAGKEEKAEDAA